MALATLIGNQPPARFFAYVWERECSLQRGAFGAAHELLTLDQFEALVAGAAADSSGRLNVVDKIARPLRADADEAAAVSAVFRSYHAGHTLLLTELQRTWRPVAQLCRALESELIGLGVRVAQRIGANAYLTPARSQGFDIHYDDHCVFVIQLAGAKQWQVYPPRVELPVERCTATIPESQLAPPCLEAELRSGDVLYIPRGFPHAARTGGDSSLHVTLSLHTLTWLAVVQAALRDKPALRRSVPMALASGDAQTYFDDELQPALAIRDIDDQLERHAAKLIARLVPVPHHRIRELDRLRLAELGPDTRVERVEGTLCVVYRDGDQVMMQLPGNSLCLPAAMEDALQFIARTRAFSPAQIPLQRATFDPVDLVRILISEGLLHVNPDRPASSARGPS
ncbi:MAG TPA: cupin domain-containing protein [Kofleriaceae bacterium]|jgi:hypothetical protein|nr:cupin domain-containing protein [Kofleriaceae bacterium]